MGITQILEKGWPCVYRLLRSVARSLIFRHFLKGLVCLSGGILHNEMELAETLFTSHFKFVRITLLYIQSYAERTQHITLMWILRHG